MPSPITVTIYAAATGLPLGGLTPSVTAERHNADGTWTTLNARTAAPGGTAGDYIFSFTDVEVPPGTFARYVVDTDAGAGLATARFLDGQVDASAVGAASSQQVGAGYAALLLVQPGETRLKVGDNGLLTWTVFYEDASGAFDLTGCTAKIFGQDRQGNQVINGRTMTVLDVAGLLAYAPQSSEVTNSLTLAVQIEITLPDTTKRSAPSRGNARIVIEPKA